MISPVLFWMLAILLGLAVATAAAVWAWKRRRPPASRPLPTEWRLSARPVFGTDERRVHRLLREALPQQVILAKLPLVRFTQPDDPNEVRDWYALLGTAHVAFAICSPSGRVLAAIDLDSSHGPSRRTLQIKQSVLAACGVRYLRCPMDSLPGVAELQRLVPQTAAPRATPRPASPPAPMPRRADPEPSWHEPTRFDDSFFALENRHGHGASTDFGDLDERRPDRRHAGRRGGDDIAGIVSDDPLLR